MKIQVKVLLFLALIEVIFIITFVIMGRSNKEQMEKILQVIQQEKSADYDKAAVMKGASLEMIVNTEYSIWSEMADFVQLGSSPEFSKTATESQKEFAETSIDILLKQYGFCGVWVYTPQYKPVYSIVQTDSSFLSSLPFSRQQFDDIFIHTSPEKGINFCHFFLRTPSNKVIEVRGASIQNTDDISRKEKPKGYFFAAREWNKDYLAEISEVIGGNINLTLDINNTLSLQQKSALEEKGTVTTERLLYGWNNKPVAKIVADFNAPLYEMFSQSMQKEFRSFIVLMLLLLAIVFFSIIIWVSNPLRRISKTLKTEDVSFIRKYTDSRSEFGELSKLIRRFFIQRMNLTSEIESHQRTEKELVKAKADADRANLAKSEFLANMSHEIRTPMNGILGMTELALATKLTEEQREYIELVKTAADNLLIVINDILDFSKIEAGKMELEEIDFDMRELLGKTMKLLALRKQNKDIEILVDIDDNIPKILSGDPGRLRQIIINLVGNALKFTECGEVICKVQLVQEQDGMAYLQFTVSDTGIGIPEEKLKTIFDPFTQADGSTTRKFGGTGLGLTITKRIIGLMGGDMHVKSTMGKGSQFIFSVQLKVGKIVTRIIPAKFDKLKNIRVLIIDDNLTNRRILEGQLKDVVQNVTLADSGTTGLIEMGKAYNAGKPFDLLLLDVQMPMMDGWEVARQIYQNVNFRYTKIFVMSSVANNISAEERANLNVTSFMAKPVTYQDMMDELLKIFGEVDVDRNIKTEQEKEVVIYDTRRLNILLAEDDLINQKLAITVLERQGHKVTLANNGVEVLQIMKKDNFDIIFMDVQMPQMDGYETTICIRENEKETNTHIPIIAMTAHAMKMHRDKCTEAGMDYYVSKPIKIEEVFSLLSQIFEGKEIVLQKGKAELEKEKQENAEALNYDRTFFSEQCANDESLMKELVKLFLKSIDMQLSGLQQAALASEAKEINRISHKMRGSISPFGAKEIGGILLKIETCSKQDNLSGIEDDVTVVLQKIYLLKNDLNDFLNDNADSKAA